MNEGQGNNEQLIRNPGVRLFEVSKTTLDTPELKEAEFIHPSIGKIQTDLSRDTVKEIVAGEFGQMPNGSKTITITAMTNVVDDFSTTEHTDVTYNFAELIVNVFAPIPSSPLRCTIFIPQQALTLQTEAVQARELVYGDTYDTEDPYMKQMIKFNNWRKQGAPDEEEPLLHVLLHEDPELLSQMEFSFGK